MKLGGVRLAGGMGQNGAQQSQTSVKEGMKAVRDWDALLSRLASVKDDAARSAILDWIGRADVLGSPAERYAIVRDALVSGTEPDANFEKRVSELGDIVAGLGRQVTDAESSGTLPYPKAMGQGSTPEVGGSLGQCILGGIALLGLIVIPLILD